MDSRRITLIGVVVFFVLILLARSPARNSLLIVLLVLGGGAALLYYLGDRPKSVLLPPIRPAKPVEDPRRAEKAAVLALTVAQAAERAERVLLRDWRTVAAEATGTNALRDLPPVLRAFFIRYAALEANDGARLTRDIKPFDWSTSQYLQFGEEVNAANQRFLRIGTDDRENPLIVKPHEETIYVLHGTRGSVDKWWAATYPSLFHWLLIEYGETPDSLLRDTG
jgi:hypothetical protein